LRQASGKHNYSPVRIRSPCPSSLFSSLTTSKKEEKMKWSRLGFVPFALLAAVTANAQVVISEVMANPKGRESGAGSPGDRNEYVELYNGDSVDIDVERWVLWDGDAYDLIEAWNDSAIADSDVAIGTTIIGVGRYAVILDPEYTDVGDTTYVQPYDFPPGAIVLTVGNTTIGDGLSGSNAVSLGTPDTTFLDTYGTPADTTDTIPFDAGDGISIERIDLRAPDREDNWAPCRDSMGTPGGKNSVTGILQGGMIMKEKVGLSLEAHPNPFLGHTVFSVIGESGCEISAWICDVAGRRVMDFGRIVSPSAIIWYGERMPPGIYFLVADDKRGRISHKVVRLR